MNHLALSTITTLLFLTLLHTAQSQHHNQLSVDHLLHKNVNYQCCNRLGGVLCGNTIPQCCAGGCRQTWYGGTSCLGMKLNISSELCPNSCKNVCRARGGIICGTSITREDCCPPYYCTGLVFKSCEGPLIPLGNCVPHTTFTKWSWG